MAENVKAATAVSPKTAPDFSGPDFSNWSCPLPLAGYPAIVMGHGGGGKLGNELVEHLFLPAFRNPELENLGDAAVLDLTDLGGGRLAMSTDSFVVQPLFFPGGSIGELAVASWAMSWSSICFCPPSATRSWRIWAKTDARPAH